jgi:thioredoxin 1
MVVMLGRGIGVALFDNGVLVRNAEFSEYIASWGDGQWADASCPPPTTLPGAPAYGRWAKRVSKHLAALDARFKPEHIIIGGSAALSLEQWQPLLSGVSAPIVHAKLMRPGESGVVGSAAGGGIQLQLRDDLARVRAAVGRMQGASPQRLTRDELKRIFRSFGAHPAAEGDDTLVLNYAEMSAAVAALGVRLTAEETQEMLVEMDTRNSGVVTFSDFLDWWADLVQSSPVALIHTEQEYDTLLEEEATSGRLLVVEVGFTFCTPCKKFAPFYKQTAKKYTDARFAYVSGNENQDTVRVGRDRLGVVGSPAFFLFRNGELVTKFSGAKEEQLTEAIEANLVAPAASKDAVAA